MEYITWATFLASKWVWLLSENRGQLVRLARASLSHGLRAHVMFLAVAASLY